ncbi:MAG: helicase-related protein, partial [Bdellovibrionaceae bacterium]|nr:helicase-related protein [Pseudobdellovibrionaceae bacterium]
LKEMWEEELQAIQVAAPVVSMESMGRADFDSSKYHNYELVLVDESHNFRNSNQRYRALSRLMSSGRKKMVLLTATPINNSVFDLYNQIMLFVRGRERYFARAGIPYLRSYFIQALEDGDLLNLLEEIMVRRTRQFIKLEFPDAVINGERIHFPERRLHTERYDLESLHPNIYKKVAELFEKLGLEVYNPEAFLQKPTHEQQLERQRNEALIGLIKSLLLKRFESSVEAFRISVQRQIEFHERFVHELVTNKKLLSSSDYRRLLALEGETETSSILQNLPMVEASAYKTVELAQVAAEDLERLREMVRLVEPIKAVDDPKIAKLVELIRARPGKKIVVFSYFQDTVRYIEKAFKEAYAKDLELVRWEVVDGKVNAKQRGTILRRFAPKSQKAQIPPEEELDLLIATDVFSEGQNLQDADTLINFDLHWNPTRMIQRAGRIDRLGSPFEVIHIHNFYPEDGLEEILGLIERLMEKITQIDKNVGLDASILGEAINPKTFNALRRIEQEDEKIADELEAEAEISSEFMRLALSKYLQRAGAEKLEAMPFGVHSGKQGKPGGRKGIFFHFRVRGEHIWRFYDVEKEDTLDSKYRIYSLIECDEETPRVEANYDIDRALEIVQKELLEDLNLQNAVSVEQMPKIQREVVSKLRGLAKHPAIDRQDLISLLKVLNQPLGRVLLKEVETIYKEHERNGSALFQTLRDFSKRYGLEENLSEAQAGPRITEDDLELVVYLTVS